MAGQESLSVEHGAVSSHVQHLAGPIQQIPLGHRAAQKLLEG